MWRAYTEPELVSRWWPGKRGTMQSCEIDFRVGGAWRYVMVASEGFEVAFHGEYQEIVDGERIVNTEVFEGAPGPGIVVTTVVQRGRRAHACWRCSPSAAPRRSGTSSWAPAWRPEPRRVSTSSSSVAPAS